MAAPRDLVPSSLKHQKMPSKRLVSSLRFGVINADDAIGMYNGFDWYGRTLEVREVWIERWDECMINVYH
jgi:hypothetical protein